jgi:hypothetical protein
MQAESVCFTKTSRLEKPPSAIVRPPVGMWSFCCNGGFGDDTARIGGPRSGVSRIAAG